MSTVKENENDEVFEDAKGEGMNIGPRLFFIYSIKLYCLNYNNLTYFILI